MGPATPEKKPPQDWRTGFGPTEYQPKLHLRRQETRELYPVTRPMLPARESSVKALDTQALESSITCVHSLKTKTKTSCSFVNEIRVMK